MENIITSIKKYSLIINIFSFFFWGFILYLDFSNHPEHKKDTLFIISVSIISVMIIVSLINIIRKQRTRIKP